MTGGSENGGWAPAEEADRCPICLGVLGRGDAAMPDSCCHVFCLGCLLTWAESQTFPSCPVDRRPFHVIYKWDATLGCVLVPVKKETCTSQPERCCTDKEPSDCLLNKQEEKPRRQKTERTLHANVKGLVKKCNDDDPSVMYKKEVRGALRFSWSLSPCGTAVGARIEGISEPLWLTEEVSSVAGRKQCRHQTQDCPWLSALVPISAWGNSRHWFHAPDWSNRHFPLRRLSPFSTSATSFGFGHFVFQGRVCAVTCPKGGGKKGGRASGSRAPAKQTESTSRRSGRNSKILEQAPTQEPASSHSHSTDSDSSANQSTQPGRSSPVATKRKGKQAANRKSDSKRKGPGRRKASPRVLSSPTPSEEEEEAEEETELREEKEREENSLGSENSDVEATPGPGQKSYSASNEEQSPAPLFSDEGQEQDEIRSQPVKDEGVNLLEEQEQVEKEKESEEIQSPPSKASINSPGMSSESQGEEDHQDPVSCGEIEDRKKMNSSPHSSSPEQPLESPQLLHSGQHKEEEQEEDTSVMEVTEDSEEVKAKDEASTEEGNAEMVPNITLKAQGASEENASENTIIHNLQDETSKSSEFRTKEDNQSKDDTNVVLMDCGLPSGEHSNNVTVTPQTERRSPANVMHLASTSLDVLEERNGGQWEPEGSSGKESQDRRNGRQRRSRFHSPTTTWSPKRESRQDSSRRSRSGSQEQTRERVGSSPPSYHSCPRSRDRERDSERDSSRRERCRERKSRKRSRSRSVSRSRSRSSSRSRSRTRSHRRGASPEQPTSGAQSPSRRKDRWGGDGWRAGQASGGDSQRNFPEREKSRYENGSFGGTSPDRSRSNDPDWVLEKTREDADARGRETASTVGNNRWEDRGDRGGVQGGWASSERGRGLGQGCYRTSNQQGEQMENRWQPRNTFSGTANNSGSDAYSRFNENRGGRRKEAEMGESALDRSGWSSASSWAVRRTLPADVQSYYSRRERGGGGGGGWTRQEEEQPAADPSKDELAPQAPSEASVPLNVMRPQLNVLHYPHGPQGLPVSLQTAAPYGMPPQVPMHLHSAVPLLQVPAVAAQGLPPPPPPPPPMQHGSLIAAQPDSRTTQMMGSHGKAPFLPNPTKSGSAHTAQPLSGQALPSSTTQPGQHSKAHAADSSKKEKKLQIQERAINEVKTAIKPYYQKKDITKEEYKEIVRKAVEKVCHSKSGDVNSGKVANLVKAYVDKYKHARKK